MRLTSLFITGLLALPASQSFSASTTNLPAGVPPALSRAEIATGLKTHDHALFVKQGWIRDPFLTVGPDHLYYLTGTTPNPGDPREQNEPYNTGLGKGSVVGSAVRIWRSPDLVDWTDLGAPFTLERDSDRKNPGKVVWAPELHWLGDRWALVHCPAAKANFAISAGPEIKGPWTHPMGDKLGDKHDPSLFKDDDGTWWFIWLNGMIAPLSQDFTHFTAPPIHLDPAGSRPGPEGTTLTRIGHEGTTILKLGKKYLFIGTGWSTDLGRKGSYNLYYCTADKITGPYGPRKFLGRFLGHGTPFQTTDGQWWCTAFYNGNVPPLPLASIETRNLAEDAQTINQRGLTLVPLDVKTLADGDVTMRAIDPAYATPGPDEVQKFGE